MNSKLSRRALLFAVVAILVVLTGITVPPGQTACATVHLPEYLSLTQPDPLQFGWNRLFFADIWSSRILILLLSAVTLATVYRWTADFDSERNRILSVAVVGLLISVQSRNLVGWTVLDSVRSLLVGLALLVVWRLSRRPSAWTQLAFATLMISMAAYGIGIIALGFGFFLLFTAKSNTKLLGVFSIVIGSVSIAIWLNDSGPTLLSMQTVALYLPVPLFFGFLWLLALVGVLAYSMDSANRRVSWLLATCLLILMVYLFTRNVLNIFTATALIPTILCLIWLLGTLPVRVKLGIAAITLILMVLPQSVDPQERAVADHLSYLNAAGMPMVIFAGGDYKIIELGERLAQSSCSLSPVDMYYIIDDQQLLETTARGSAELLPLDTLHSLSGFSLIDSGDQPLEVLDKQTISNDAVPQYDLAKYKAAFYYATPADEKVYQTENVLMHSFRVKDALLREANSFKPGDKMVVASWWSITTPIQENFVAKFSIINAQGLPLVAQESLLGKLFTGAMAEGQWIFHRELLRIPLDAAAGDYSLVVSMHGTSQKTANQRFSQPGGADVGEYAYLTTIHITSNK